jgi:hypothetical protein
LVGGFTAIFDAVCGSMVTEGPPRVAILTEAALALSLVGAFAGSDTAVVAATAAVGACSGITAA